ncbi:hypothetical protein HKX48_009330 [Thoreauomyces humboldtii]|nr:hypothetical protein HKX48_009330 [Thoreauomyces humboldtii]
MISQTLALSLALTAFVPSSALGLVARDDASTVGSWTTLTSNTGVVPIHVAHVPGDKILMIERVHYIGLQSDGFTAQEYAAHLASPWYAGNPNLVNQFMTDSAELDLNTGNYTLIPNRWPLAEQDSKNEGYAFCSGHAQLASGDYIIVGGDQFWDKSFQNSSRTSNGRHDIRFYTPSNSTSPANFRKVANMFRDSVGLALDTAAAAASNNTAGAWTETNLNGDQMYHGRWYPSVITMPNEDILSLGGQRYFFAPQDPNVDNPTYEKFTPSTLVSQAPVNVSILARHFPLNMYPVAYVLPKSGKLFTFVFNETAILDVDAGTETAGPALDLTKQNGLLGRNFPFVGSNFVPILSPRTNYKMSAWFCGGVNTTAVDGTTTARDFNSTSWYASCSTCQGATRCNYIDDIEDPTSQFQDEDMPLGRSQPTAVNLPDGTIALFSGSGKGHQGGTFGLPSASQGVKAPVIFNPAIAKGQAGRWVVGAAAPTARHYHNSALLREDGTVFTAGGDSQNGDDPINGRPDDMTMDVYSPPYMSISNRPAFSLPLATSSATYGQQIVLSFTSAVAQTIKQVSIIRYASVTHSTNLDQRHIELEIVHYATDKLLVTLPANASLAAPGNWMVWAVDSRGAPVVKAGTISLRAGNPSTAAVWADADTVATPTFSNVGNAAAPADGSTAAQGTAVKASSASGGASVGIASLACAALAFAGLVMA